MGLTIRKTRTFGIGPVLPPTTQHFNFTILAPIKYLSSDRTMTWSVRTLCRLSRSFTFRCQICDHTNIRWVAIWNLRISLKIWCYFTASQQILVRSQIWQRQVEELLKLPNLYIDHVMIRWDLGYFIGVKVAGTVKWNWGGDKTWSKNGSFVSSLCNNSTKTKRVRFLAGSGTELNWNAGQNTDHWQVIQTHC